MIEHNYFPKGADEFERYIQEAETCSAKEHCIQLLKQELKQSKEEEKYLKECCEKAGKELGRYSFEWDGKEKNLVVQALQLNEQYENLQKENAEITKDYEEAYTKQIEYADDVIKLTHALEEIREINNKWLKRWMNDSDELMGFEEIGNKIKEVLK